MMYMILGRDSEDSAAARASSRLAHLERIHELIDDGNLVLAGPLPAIDAEDPGPAGFNGSLVIAEFDSLDAAKQWAEDDPYVHAGAWVSVEVQPFKQVLP